ncbi:Sensor histidine kinase YpdA [Dyella sp. AD56]|uniref:sensor histidine kinase n=1 Tax=Dyella sp. AD56 TaxID=1528744 RepID=UPI000CA7F1E8|nr:histidine kinase [Dyella sp. AD56]PMQ06796.1 Sensor histidine kinase YpdA [Dyella sp. AD56]
MTPEHDSFGRPKAWLLHVGGWVAYGLVSALGALPYRRAYPVLLYFAGTTAAAFLASFVMLALCRRLAAGRLPWPRAMTVIVACSYVLGVVCSVSGAALEAAAGHVGPEASHWRAVALVGFANAFSPAIMLVAWSAIYGAAQHWREARLRERELLLAESLAREAELKALRYQITPHFLFNTLNGISTLVGEGDARSARRMIALLANFLRATLEPARQGDVTLAQELAQVQQYVEIEQIRLGRRLVVSIHCDPEARNALVPHLLLQPLVENAVRHGIAPSPEGGTLSLSVCRRDGIVEIAVRNSLSELPAQSPSAGGLGLANTAARLAARYRDAYRFSASGDTRKGWLATMEIPHQTATELAT